MSADGRVGQTIGRYRVDAVLGRGGFATVYRALDLTLERPVALKVLETTVQRDPTTTRRFIREGRAVANLDHPAIVPVYDAGEDGNLLWLAMRLVSGGSLDRALASGRRFEPDETLGLVGRIASALDHAHGAGVVHRDVKPSNIVLDEDEPTGAWLTDFGISTTVRSMGLYTTGALGTAAYMAPEQARPNQVGPPADRYSLGCVAYELLCGRRPFPGSDHVALLMAHATQPVPSTGSPALDEFMARALAKSPEHRPTSGVALVEDLRQAVRASPSPLPAAPASTVVPAGYAPTAAEHHHTLVNPAAQPGPEGAPSPAPPSPSASPGAPGRSGAPLSPPAAGQPMAQRKKGRSARRVLAGLLLLTAAAAGIILTQMATERSSPDLTEVRDAAGVRYSVPKSWTCDEPDVPCDEREGPELIYYDEEGTRMASTLNAEATTTNAAAELEDAGICDAGPTVLGEPPPGSNSAARCDDPTDPDAASVLAAIVDDRVWIITATPDAPEEDVERVLESLEFTPPPE